MVIKEAIHKFPNVWEVTKSQVSYPKGSIHEHPIPTNPKNPEWYVKAYHQSPGKQKFLHDYADDLYKHGIIEDADRRCCITPALAVTKPGAPAGVFRFAQDFRAGNKFTRALTDRHGLPAGAPTYRCGLRVTVCLLYTSPSSRDGLLSRMPSSA